MRQAKGLVFILFVKAIRADKTGAYDSLLTDADREVISQRIMPSSWVPFDTYKRCVNAVAEIVAKGDADMLREWGRAHAEETLTTVYRGAVRDKDPKKAVERFAFYFGNMFNFGTVKGEFVSANRIQVALVDFDPDFEAFGHIARGWIEKFMEMCVGNGVSCDFATKSWEGAPVTSYEITWSE